MNSYRLAWFAGTLGILVGCSGKYDAGFEPSSSAGSSGAKPDGSSGSGVGGASDGGAAPSTAGSPAAGGGSSVGGTSTGVGGNGVGSSGVAGSGTPIGVAGASTGTAGAPSSCGVVLTPPATIDLASAAVIWRRLSLFLDGEASEPPIGLPATITRETAGGLAMIILDRASPKSAPGMDRFVASWWPGTPIASTWAAYFSTKGGTLSQLLTTNAVASPGSGMLTDEAVLKNGGVRISPRGAFLSAHLLCIQVPPSPPLPPSAAATPGETRRQWLEKTVASPTCRSCHQLMDPLGTALEHFDTAGSYGNLDNGSPIDSSGDFQGNGFDIQFDTPNQLGLALAGQCAVAQCVAQQMLADAETSAKLPKAGSSDPALVAPIAAAFIASGGDLHTLVRQIVQSDTFLRP